MRSTTFSRRFFRYLCPLLLLCLFAGCDAFPTLSLGSTSQTPVPTANSWNQVVAGVEVRQETWSIPDGSGDGDTVTIVRFDLNAIKLSVAYQPDQPLSMQQWMQKEQAVAVMNGGYFDGLDNATALVVSDGHVAGTSYQGFGGMLDVDAQGQIQLRSLRDQPYSAVENLTQATQSSPMLLMGGKRTQFSADSKTSPRTVVALDKQGRLLFIVSPGITFTLDEMATQLAQSDLGLTTALNLDGGSSTGLYVRGGNQNVSIDSYTNLPIVIVVKKK